MTLTPEHAAAIIEPIRRQLAYLSRLRTRLERRGFTPADTLYQRVHAAWSAAHALHVEVHYQMCDPAKVARGDDSHVSTSVGDRYSVR